VVFWCWGPTPPDLAVVRHAYTARFSIEHTFRCFKQTLTWATPKLRQPEAEAADRWTWLLLLLAYVQLRLARDLVADVRFAYPGSGRCRPRGGRPRAGGGGLRRF
jgi:hypothetical protein